MHLNDSIVALKGVGSVRIAQFEKAGIATVEDLLNNFPTNYNDFSVITNIANIRPGLVSLRAKLHSASSRRMRRALHITEAIAEDKTGKIKVVWFNQPYRKDSLKNETYLIRGEYKLQAGKLQLLNPQIEIDNNSAATNGTELIIAKYKESAGLKSEYIRKIIKNARPYFDLIKERLPESVVTDNHLMTLKDTYLNLHFPSGDKNLELAKERMAFEEILISYMASKALRQEALKENAPVIPFNEQVAKQFVEQLPFKLTNSQRSVAWQIYKDINKDTPMNRLVEGDVGSGKTVVAAMAAVMAMNSGYQVAFLAPTEILARQHLETLKRSLSHTNYVNNIDLLVGSLKPKQKKQIKDSIAVGNLKLVVGTHALLEQDIHWKNLSLLVIDEQHRFGVEQRQKIIKRSGKMPHILCLTATPIPRTLALTVYGELSISIISELPKRKASITTHIVSPNSLERVFSKVTSQLNDGRQAFVVCPLISESSLMPNKNNAEAIFEKLSKTVFKQFSVGLIHGKIKPEQKESIMNQFRSGHIQVLVSTTVVEVGVDVPNATEMLIYDANWFGLAQLHQLRGRVGRGTEQGTCYLIMSDSSAPPKRLRAMLQTDNGFELAELDLELRGPGAIYGTLQHGKIDLQFAKLTDTQLISKVRDYDNSQPGLLNNMLKYKQLAESIKNATRLTYLN
jgi:ATP-dependent DNA helicase RecG